MKFYDYTLSAAGEMMSHRLQDSDTLAQVAVQIFADLIAEGDTVRRQVSPYFPNISLYWTSAGDEALATFYIDEIPATSSALVLGDGEATVLTQLTDMLAEASRRRDILPLRIRDRPLIVSLVWLVWPVPYPVELGIIADMETCLAAAYFESLRRSDERG